MVGVLLQPIKATIHTHILKGIFPYCVLTFVTWKPLNIIKETWGQL